MLDFEAFTPEMLVYYNALPPRLQDAVRADIQTPDSMETLAAVAEKWAQSGLTGLE